MISWSLTVPCSTTHFLTTLITTGPFFAINTLITISLRLMNRKRLIVLCLLPAYLLLVLHAIIPHHHHFSAEDGPLSFHHGFNTLHQEHLAQDHHNDADGHGHTAHFVHYPEFGTAMVIPGVKWIDNPLQTALTGIISDFSLVDRIIHIDRALLPFPESPPRYISPAASAISLRGPPSYTII